MKKKIFALCAAMVFAGGAAFAAPAANAEKLSVICSNFAEYDFVRQITGDAANVKMLLRPGMESHSFDPTVKDILDLQNCGLFVYVGGDSDAWVDKVLASFDKDKGPHVVKLMDLVETVPEEIVEGMQHDHDHDHDGDDDHEHAHHDHGPDCDHGHDHDAGEEGHHHHDGEEPELDEHVWTAPENAIQIVKKLSEVIAELDPENKARYASRAAAYLEQLRRLDKDFRELIDGSKRREIIVGDRFPFLYFCREFGLKYYAAFPGCANQTEPNPETVAFLIDKVKQDQIPVVFHIELSNGQMARAIADATGAQVRLLNAVHNVSAEDFEKGTTYLDLMRHNLNVLKEALN
ncbi:MAG: metal ABC transporter substrate-binding protein [Pyramidobacter porci]|uniref:metal ABC transporter substrate-binding protein n=1 Tax=Pyramidobacter porci TaxID=2605789 RepID=UPI002A7531E5|nr:metal ABC transporter substrate-binding protein [Pyramidobacter porci]MDY2648973.1 metal ABC transporter substrate-binding protein [Pyramidobacter porci]